MVIIFTECNQYIKFKSYSRINQNIMKHQSVKALMANSLAGRFVAKRFVMRKQLCWFPGIIRNVRFYHTGMVVCIDFFDGDTKYYSTLLNNKVFVCLPRCRSKFAKDSKQFMQQFYESRIHPYPHQGTTIFIHHNEALIKCYVKHYNMNTKLHEVIHVHTGEHLTFRLAHVRGNRWFWFCDNDINGKIPRSLVCKYELKKREMMETFKSCLHYSQHAKHAHFLQVACDNWLGQFYTWPLFMKNDEWERYKITYTMSCSRIMCLNTVLPVDILHALIPYMVPVDITNTSRDIYYHLL